MLFLLQILSLVLLLRFCVHGEKNILRIVGTGTEAGGRFSWVVRLVHHDGEVADCGKEAHGGYGLICSGSLINNLWVLAAGHCADATHVQLNMKTSETAREGEKDKVVLFRKILKVNVHPGYKYQDTSDTHSSRGRLENDIALFKTEDIKMPHYGKLDSRDFRGLFGREVYFVGYGLSKYRDNYKKQEEIDKELITGPLKYGTGLLGDCATVKYQGSLMHQDLHFNFCVMRKCSDFALMSNGDSGGPVVVDDKIIGINTVMIQDREKEPSEDLMSVVATPISPYIDWIQELAKNSTTDFYK